MTAQAPLFVRNAWYVARWSNDLPPDGIAGITILGEPVAVVRRTDGTLDAYEDRCPHRHAALSQGRVEGQNLRCMYHGLLFDRSGHCLQVPGTDTMPPVHPVHTYPVCERDDWIWVWMGDPAHADENLVPRGFGLSTVAEMQAGSLDYDAYYELVNDNLCDLSHVDFVHGNTLSKASGGGWSDERFRMKPRDRMLEFDRWFTDVQVGDGRVAIRTDRWARYRYHVPGIFIMESHMFPAGTAEACDFGEPDDRERVSIQYEQQAVTPIDARRTRYFYATGATGLTAEQQAGVFKLVQAAFAEDRQMIEAQQRIHDLTDPDTPKAFIPQDRGPAAMRRLLASLAKAEQAEATA